jgi:CRP-like cAMP-binding protein
MNADEIAAIPLFAQLDATACERIAGAAKVVRLDVGEPAVREGEFAFAFYAIVRGAAEVVHAGERLATLSAGEVFGELGVVPSAGHAWSRRRNATVIATEPTEVIEIDGRIFRQLTEEIPALRHAVETMAASRGR